MAIDIKFDLTGNPEPPIIILANRNGNKLGQLNVDAKSVNVIDKFNDASEFSFTLNKYIDGEITPLWDKVVDFKLVYCKEWDTWFEIKVELDEATETVKTVYCTQLGQAELSQINLYNIEINTEKDIERDDYKISILYDKDDPKSSILNRMLEKAPHYRIAHVAPTIANIQRSFSFDDTSIYDGLQEIAEEIGCLFDFPSNSGEDGKIQRDIFVYDLQQSCNDCGHRGEYIDKCPKCGSTNIMNGYGEDTLIFVTSDELASGGIELSTDVDAVKNCFKLEAGDDLMTATVRSCNPNGTDYIWYFSDAIKEDMPKDLVDKLNSYNELYKNGCSEHISDLDINLLQEYNSLVDKYSVYNEDLQRIETPVKGYSALMNAYYDTIDLALYLKSGLMPSVEMSGTSAEEQADLLASLSLSPVAVADITKASLSTVNSAVLAMAKIIVKPTYKVEIKASELYDIGNKKYWKGSFTVTNYSDVSNDEDTSDEKDVADSDIISVEVNDDTEAFVKQKIDKALNKEDTNDLSISGLFELEYDDFCDELKKYALNPLTSFYDSCQVCIDILTEQGVGSKDSWSDDDEGSDANLYEKLYVPYYNKLAAIEAEMKVREDEINIVCGVYDTDGNLIVDGLQTSIESNRNAIQSALDFEKYLGEELWLEFCAYRRDDKYSNENYISDGLNNAEQFNKALEFFEVAQNEIYKSAELQHSISTTLKNLLAIPKFKPFVKSFKNGNWIRVQVDDRVYKLRLLEYEIDFGDFDTIPVEFSDVTKIKNGTTDVKDILEQASSMATSYSSIQRQASQGNDAKSTITQWISDGLNAALVQIQNNDNEDISMTKNGLLCRSYDDITGAYLPEQLKLTHNIIAYTDNNWESVKQAIGKHEYKLYDKGANGFVDKVGYGMNADFVTAGVVSGSQIIGGDIYSDNYSIADGTGSYLNLRDGTFSFGGGSLRFEKDENGEAQLLISSPNVVTKNEVTTINEEYLKTTTVYAANLKVGSANIQGELTAAQINTAGLIAENISGTTIDGKTITGGSISIGDNFSVDTGGSLIASSADITGTITTSNLTATGGYIGGWTIAPKDPKGNTYTGGIYKDVGEYRVGMKAEECGAGDAAFYVTKNPLATNTDGSFAGENIFYVQHNGKLFAKDAEIEGKITCNNGTIGGWDIGDNSIAKVHKDDKRFFICSNPVDDVNSNSYDSWLAAGVWNGAKWEYPFYVLYDGTLKTTKAEIEGKITATEGSFSREITIEGKPLSDWIGEDGNVNYINATGGTIGGWNIGKSSLASPSNNTYIDSDGTFYFSPKNGDCVGLVQHIDTGKYHFVIGNNTVFQLGSTLLTESQLIQLLNLI